MYLEESQILLNNIRLYAYHGVMDQERRVGGWYLVSLTINYPFSRSLETDDVADTLNYASVLEVVKEEMSIPSNLIEHVAGRIGKSILTKFPLVDAVKILLTKENPPMGGDTQGASVLLCIKNDKKPTINK